MTGQDRTALLVYSHMWTRPGMRGRGSQCDWVHFSEKPFRLTLALVLVEVEEPTLCCCDCRSDRRPSDVLQMRWTAMNVMLAVSSDGSDGGKMVDVVQTLA